MELANDLQKLIDENPMNYLGRKLDVKCECDDKWDTLHKIQAKYGHGIVKELATKLLK